MHISNDFIFIYLHVANEEKYDRHSTTQAVKSIFSPAGIDEFLCEVDANGAAVFSTSREHLS